MQNLNIMIVGVGGQGTLLASRIIGSAALKAGFEVKVSEVHGMSQRGGSVETYVRLGKNIASPLVDKGQADIIICFEQLEALRFMPYLKKGGTLIVNERIIESLKEKLANNIITLDAAAVASECGDIRSVNVVLLGVMAGLELLAIS